MEIFSWKIKVLPLSHGEGIIAILNSQEAAAYGISATDKVSLVRNKQEYVVDVSLSDEIKPGTIGASQELISEYPIMEGDNVLVSFVRNNPLSLQAIRKSSSEENSPEKKSMLSSKICKTINSQICF